MPRLEVRTTEGVTLDLEVVGAGTRFTAGLLDAMIMGTVLLGAILAVGLASNFDPTGASEFMLSFMGMGVFLFVVVYQVGFHWQSSGRTPGKSALGIRVISADGQPASLAQLVLRGVITLADILPLPLPVGLVVIAVSPKRQRLGDLAAGTLVIREPRPVGRAREPWSHETWESMQVRRLDLTPRHATQFDERDVKLLRAVATRRTLDPTARRRLIERVGAHYRKRLEIEQRIDPRAVVKELYLFLREQQKAS
jgi:uncharacterized RDD family membrane protein YckC